MYAYLVVEWAPLPKVDGAGAGLQLLSEPEGARAKEACCLLSVSVPVSVPVSVCLSLFSCLKSQRNATRVFLRCLVIYIDLRM